MIPPLFAIFSWPVVVAILFSQLNARNAILCGLLGGYLLLPEKVTLDLPGLPGLDKDSLTALVVFLGAAIAASSGKAILPGWLPRIRAVTVLMFLIPIMAIATSLTNQDTLVYGPRVIPGLSMWEAASVTINVALGLLPMLVARRFLADPDGQLALLYALVIAGLLYSLPALWEIRMSPQLNLKVYGFYQSDFAQNRRGDGFRPLVFLQHGLWLSLFLSSTCLAALALVRADRERSRYWILAAIWLAAVVLLSKSIGALAVTVILGFVAFFFSPRTQLIVAAVVAGMVLTYPVLRGANVIPVESIYQAAAKVDAGRAASLRYRLNTEQRLLAKSEQRPLFGWGRFGRETTYDPVTGRRDGATDGYWVGKIAQNGWLGYITQFGLLCFPIILIAVRVRKIRFEAATIGLTLVLAGNLVDLIPNAGLTPVTWIIVGALIGRIEYGAAEPVKETEAKARETRPVYTRAREPKPSPDDRTIARTSPAKQAFSRFTEGKPEEPERGSASSRSKYSRGLGKDK